VFFLSRKTFSRFNFETKRKVSI